MTERVRFLVPEREGEPSDWMDGPAAVGQFLRDVNLVDLVVELVQNDLDAKATRTTIDFGEQGLICNGNGRPFDRKGWLRLESVLGAGGEVEAKKDGIGSKNHGLRSLFLIADRVGVQSAGLRADLTVRGDHKKPARFKPGFWPRIADPDAPQHGTRITAPYREDAVKVPDGDDTTLHPLPAGRIDAIFEDAVADAAERFISASSPGSTWQYTLVLSRHGRATREFLFECRPLNSARRGLWLRTCKIREDGRPLRTIARRHSLRFPIQVQDGGKIPRLFRRGRRLLAELNWQVDRVGRPLPSRGRLRYPIAFTSPDARSGHGFDVSAPFIAGRSRHDVSNDDRNPDLVRQARRAFAHAGPLLGEAYGCAGAALIRSLEPRPEDEPEEQAIVEEFLKSGGLRVAKFKGGGIPEVAGDGPAPVDAPLTLVKAKRPSFRPVLCGLASKTGPILHPRTPEAVQFHLVALAAAGSGCVCIFDEQRAAQLVFIETLKAKNQWDEDMLAAAKCALQALETLRQDGGIPHELVQNLTKSGALPGYAGTIIAWHLARRLDQTPPTIPGVSSPPVVHRELLQPPVLVHGTLALHKFDLNDRLGSLDFSNVLPEGRQSFFQWLQSNAPTLKAATLRRIGAMPIWPGGDGIHRPLFAYCRPKARFLQTLLADTLTLPAPATAALATSRKLSRTLSLRDKPTEEELLSWHASALAEIRSTPDSPAADERLAKLEAALDWLRPRRPEIMLKVGAVHETRSQAGQMKPLTALHVPSDSTLACGLPPSTLTRTRRSALYLALGAQPRPSAPALLDALRNDPDSVKLFARLEAYKGRERDLSKLAAEPIVPVNGTPRAGETLAFVGEPDYWGDWKIRVKSDDVAEHHALLAQLGVIRPRPTRELSIAFFTWLAHQPRNVQRQHHPHVDRHWRDRSAGPLAWCRNFPHIPCTPVAGSSRSFELVSFGEASDAARPVYLDDFPEIREAVLKQSKARLTLIKAPGTRSTILDILAAVELPSLRAEFGTPQRIRGQGTLETVPELSLMLSQLQSRAGLTNLRAKLPLYGVSMTDLRSDWQRHLKALKGVRSSGALIADYRFMGQLYEVSIRGGIDRSSGLVCLAADSDRLHETYEVLAGYLFRTGRENAWGLLRAARDRRQLEMFAAPEDTPDEDEDEPTASEEPIGEIHKGHGLGTAKTTPVVPDPKPLPIILNHTPKPKPKRRSSSAGRHPEGSFSVEEEEQKRALKQEHYGYHCQACIGEMEVLKAAPPGTYVYAPGYRQRLLHAHHAHQKQNRGPLGGHNLLILCEYHHRLWGDRLARACIRDALASATTIRRLFPRDDAGKDLQPRDGLLAIVKIDVAPFAAKLYFTSEHAAAWTSGDAE